jgi:molybdopterin molybdotransferase
MDMEKKSMPEFFNVVTHQDALEILGKNIKTLTTPEKLKTSEAAGRITAESVFASDDLPLFSRSTMDGYAVRSADTFCASEGFPAYLKIIGEVRMGQRASMVINKGEAVKIHTGGMLVTGADAVVMVENTQPVDASSIEVVRPAAPGENVLRTGDDIKKGELLISVGHQLRPQDIGGLMGLGITEIAVYKKPRISIISTGDEIIPSENQPQPGQVRDINTYTISALTEQAGGIAIPRGIIKDDLDNLKQAARSAFEESEIVVISAGSSVSTRDMTSRAIESLGKPGILVYGVAIRPGKPTIIAVCDGKPVFGLPGNPVSTVVTFNLFVRPAIFKTGGCEKAPGVTEVTAKLAQNIPSTTGRVDFVPVKLDSPDGVLTATPVFGESNLITTLIRADGLAVVPLDLHGLKAGEAVRVKCF